MDYTEETFSPNTMTFYTDDYTNEYDSNYDITGGTEIVNRPIGLSVDFQKKYILANRITFQAIGIIATVLNTFNLIVYRRNKQLWTISNLMLINVSLSDLVLGVSLIAVVNLRIITNDIILKYAMVFTLVLQTLGVYMTSMCIFSMSFERWVAITFPFFHKVKFTMKKAYILVMLTWMYGCMIGVIKGYYLIIGLPAKAYR